MIYGEIISQIKKEWLQKHLDETEDLIKVWLKQLRAPEPFKPDWNSVYKPNLERDADENHILRKHIRSRSLWKHHSDWEIELAAIKTSMDKLRKIGKSYVDQLVVEAEAERKRGTGPRLCPTDKFLETALEYAFASKTGQVDLHMPSYGHRPDGGVNLGRYRIESSVSLEEVQKIAEKHGKLITVIKDTAEFKMMMVQWDQAKTHEDSMTKIVSDTLKSYAILYPCRFCRKHFW